MMKVNNHNLSFLFFCLVSAELVPGQFQAMAIQERQHSIDGLGSMLESSLSCTQQLAYGNKLEDLTVLKNH